MNLNTIPLLSEKIKFYPINKNDFFIHQTSNNHRIKITSELYDFLKLIDNKTTLQTLVLDYNLTHNKKLTNELAYSFLYKKLAKYDIIKSKDIAIIPNEKPDYLKLSFIVINEKTVSKFTKYLRYLFFPKTMKSIFIIASIVILGNFYFYNYQIAHHYITKPELLFFFFLSFIGITFHEFGHASASHHYGAKHGGIGGGFYLFVPVYFADVTDIWKLPKNQRIIVNLAGMYFEMIYALLLILIGTLFNFQLLIILTCLFSMATLRNLNPFARSDGYWILSDAIEKPNLMKHGLLKVKQIFKSKKGWQKLDYLVLIYGLISQSFILFFVYIVVVKNPASIIYFPHNIKTFVSNLLENGHFSITELGKLLIPIFFFYMLFGFLKKIIIKFNKKNTNDTKNINNYPCL